MGGYGGFGLVASIYDEATLEPLKIVELIPGRQQRIEGLQVDATRRVQLAVQIEFEDPGDLAPSPGYHYLFTYLVTDADGNPLFEQQGRVATDQGVRITRRTQDAKKLMRVEHRLQRFQVPFPGVMGVDFFLQPDSAIGKQPLSLSLRVYEGVSTDVRGAIVGGSLVVLGGLIALVGLIFLLVHAFSGNTQAPLQGVSGKAGVDEIPAGQGASGSLPAAISDDQIRTIAMWCHLAALAGFIVPLGNVLGPLIVWLTQRDKSPFIDNQGKEAVNFQLSLLIYSAVCFLLILILVGFLLLLALSLGAMALVIIAAIQANQGVAYRYPLIIRFIR